MSFGRSFYTAVLVIVKESVWHFICTEGEVLNNPPSSLRVLNIAVLTVGSRVSIAQELLSTNQCSGRFPMCFLHLFFLRVAFLGDSVTSSSDLLCLNQVVI